MNVYPINLYSIESLQPRVYSIKIKTHEVMRKLEQ
jgi:hypothetical protein